jgi:hypothetical protein
MYVCMYVCMFVCMYYLCNVLLHLSICSALLHLSVNVLAIMQEHGVDATFAVVPQAGHHLYLDNTEEFHRVVDAWMRKSVHHTT